MFAVCSLEASSIIVQTSTSSVNVYYASIGWLIVLSNGIIKHYIVNLYSSIN